MTDNIVLDIYREADNHAANTAVHKVLIRAAYTIHQMESYMAEADVTMQSLANQIDELKDKLGKKDD